MAHEKTPQLPLPVSTPSDLGRLIRDLTAVNDQLVQLNLRKGGKDVQLPKTSLLLEQAAELNGVNLLHEDDRKQLLAFLQAAQKSAPRLHFSFSADPAPAFMEKLVGYLRKEFHPQALITVGLQPTLGAGCIVRANSKQFDFSLKEDFARKRGLLVEKIRLSEAPV